MPASTASFACAAQLSAPLHLPHPPTPPPLLASPCPPTHPSSASPAPAPSRTHRAANQSVFQSCSRLPGITRALFSNHFERRPLPFLGNVIANSCPSGRCSTPTFPASSCCQSLTATTWPSASRSSTRFARAQPCTQLPTPACTQLPMCGDGREQTQRHAHFADLAYASLACALTGCCHWIAQMCMYA
eukprot:4515451-Pleurochrysis_carterae.AAC.1